MIEEQNQWKAQQERIEQEENEQIRKYIEEQDAKMDQIRAAEEIHRQRQHEMQMQMCNQLNDIEVCYLIENLSTRTTFLFS